MATSSSLLNDIGAVAAATGALLLIVVRGLAWPWLEDADEASGDHGT
jgi:hypothetical protein